MSISSFVSAMSAKSDRSKRIANRSHHHDIILVRIRSRWTGVIAVVYLKVEREVMENFPADIEIEYSSETAIRGKVSECVQGDFNRGRIRITFVASKRDSGE